TLQTFQTLPTLESLVGRWTIDRRQRDVVEAQIDRQLPAVMDAVIEDEAAERGDARHGEHLVPAASQRPRRHQLRIGLVEPLPGRLRRLVERREDLVA